MDLSDERAAAVVDAIGRISQPIAELVRVRWREHTACERPLLVLFGPHNAGKSNILKRLLIDDGLAVPGWLRTGPRPEDTTGDVVTWDGWRILDLPGIGSEQHRHDDTAWDALELADAVLLVMSLKLLTGEGLEALEVVDGSWWSADGTPLPWLDGALHIAVARVDSGPADPEDDPDQLVDLKAGLEPAIERLLAPRGQWDSARLHWTAASPSGILDRAADLSRDDLDRFRGWDGMRDLADTLRSAAGSKEFLRASALIRFLHRSAKVAKVGALQELAELRHQLERAEQFSRHRALVNEQVDGVLGSVEAKLTAVVLGCFTVALDGGAQEASPAVAMERAFAAQAEAFEAKFVAEVDVLVEEIRRLVEDLPDVPMADRHGFAANASTPKATGPTLDVKETADSLSAIAKRAVEVRLNAAVPEVKKKLEGLKGLEGEDLTKALAKAGFDSAEDAEAARRVITRFEQASRILEGAPQAEELYRHLRDYRRGKLRQSEAKKAADQQDKLVAGLVQQLLDEDPGGYRTRLERLRQAALGAFGDSGDVEEHLRSAVADLEQDIHALDDAVADLSGRGLG